MKKARLCKCSAVDLSRTTLYPLDLQRVLLLTAHYNRDLSTTLVHALAPHIGHPNLSVLIDRNATTEMQTDDTLDGLRALAVRLCGSKGDIDLLSDLDCSVWLGINLSVNLSIHPICTRTYKRQTDRDKQVNRDRQ